MTSSASRHIQCGGAPVSEQAWHDRDIPPDLVLAGVSTMFKAPKTRWAPEDDDIVREHYPKGGLAAVRPYLLHKTDCSIHWRARILKVKAPGYQRQVETYFSTPHIDEAIRRYYEGTPRKGGMAKLAHQLRRPASWVSARARQLGCVQPRFMEPDWSDAEVTLLRAHAAKVPQSISRVLARHGYRRTAGAINNKLRKLRCDRTDNEHYTSRQLADLFGVQQYVVSGWIKKGWLYAKGKGTDRENDIFAIHHKDVRRFVIENAAAIDIRRIEKHWFIDLLANTAA